MFPKYALSSRWASSYESLSHLQERLQIWLWIRKNSLEYSVSWSFNWNPYFLI